MSKPRRSIASFSDVAQVGNDNDNTNKNYNENINVNINNVVNKNTSDNNYNNVYKNKNDNANNTVNKNDNNNIIVYDDDILSSIMKQPANKKPTGIYFENDVLEKLKELTKGRGRGAQSKLVNDVLKRYFIQKGFLTERRE